MCRRSVGVGARMPTRSLAASPPALPRMAPELALRTFEERTARQAAELGAYSANTVITANLLDTRQRGEYELRRLYVKAAEAQWIAEHAQVRAAFVTADVGAGLHPAGPCFDVDTAGYAALLTPGANTSSPEILDEWLTPGNTRVVIQERLRVESLDVPKGDGFDLYVDGFLKSVDAKAIAEWKAKRWPTLKKKPTEKAAPLSSSTNRG